MCGLYAVARHLSYSIRMCRSCRPPTVEGFVPPFFVELDQEKVAEAAA